MPIYEYECDKNGHRFERWQSVNDAQVRVCEICGAPVHKVFHPAGIIFKGSGWYKTDSRPKTSEPGDKSEVKTEAKSDKKSASAPPSDK